MSGFAIPVLGVQHILQLPPTAAADPEEEDGQRDYGDTTDTSNDTTDSGSDEGRRVSAFGEANLIILAQTGVPGLDDEIERAQKKSFRIGIACYWDQPNLGCCSRRYRRPVFGRGISGPPSKFSFQ